MKILLIVILSLSLIGCSVNSFIVPNEVELEINGGQQTQVGSSTSNYHGGAIHLHYTIPKQ